ncbi:ENTH-domain-containing protein [Wolfiporia cocos MD-104 SS10]|uniref:ENTH-domain-containing protein n=1 Tax=Wolfiporia cocos (strain MD-104) TaxID=742152 RepID=A0A2H3JDW9_WOLCO|nr:ENTH-domain-containing protein [Wolfiporia cocos MD-104 SS10]
MDRIESLSNTLSQITMYDIKSMYNQAKNVVFNVSEMEAKVREATNDEPWGASSTLMQEIAQGTFNFQNFNEIMPAIYARFMEKEARQWRQIYKALQLLEYLVKNGSERVVDDARSHVATIKMLRNFYYIDDKGKDQGLNVRNRSRELVDLLSDVEKIRTERRKAKANKNKYTGVGNDPMSFTSGGSRYGGFGNDSLGYGGGYSGSSSGGDYSSRDYGGSYSGGGSSGFRDETPRRGYQEYDAGDDEELPRRSNSINNGRSPAPAQRSTTSPAPSTPTTAKAPEPAPVVDLLGMDDDDFGSTSNTATAPAVNTAMATNKALPTVTSPIAAEADDDFDDFQTAPTSAPLAPAIPATQPAKPLSPPLFQAQAPLKAVSPPLQAMSSPIHAALTPGAARASYMSPMQNPMFPSQPALTPQPVRSNTSPPVAGTQAQAKPASSANFDDLWSMSLGSAAAKPAASPAPAKSIKEIEKEKAQAGIWGTGQSRPPMGGGFGSFGSAASTPAAAAPPSSSGNGLDDLLF